MRPFRLQRNDTEKIFGQDERNPTELHLIG
jgi:hypothetical protein